MGCNPIALAITEDPQATAAPTWPWAKASLWVCPWAMAGPTWAIMATTSKHMRKLPGRIVGETADSKGETRLRPDSPGPGTAHPPGEGQVSNICSNEALCALTASIYMAAMGPQGMAEVARQSMAKAHYLAKGLCAIEGVALRYERSLLPRVPHRPAQGPEQVLAALEQAGILGGLPVEGGILWCATEKASKEALDQTVAIVKEVLAQ